MPLMDDRGQFIPFFVLNEEWAQRNHCQTLAQLAARGGLGMAEAVAIIERRKWRPMSDLEARKRLDELLRPVTCSCGLCGRLTAEVERLRARCGRLAALAESLMRLDDLRCCGEVRASDPGFVSAMNDAVQSQLDCERNNDLKEPTDG